LPAERDPLIDLAGLVADGQAVDWGSAHSSAGSDADSAAVRELEVIAAIARLHRQATPELAARPSTKPELDDPAAQRWGPLVILEPLGSGSFGEVFRAWDTSLDREVALKLLRRRTSIDGVADTIAREGQLLARIHHANVMAIYGALAIDGQVGIWGELLKGRTLANIVADSGPFSADETLVFADAIGRALAAVHRAGLLHRDVKAQNVIREQGGRIVLMDFGLGRDVNTTITSDVDLAGTPLYMAPELFAGGRASVQSDLYSFGVLMFFLATATFPVTGRSSQDIRTAHAGGRRQRLQDLRPDLPVPFVHIVERALEPDPSRRFESAGAMQAAITAATHLHAADDGDAEAVRSRLRWVVAVAVITGASAIAFASLWFASRPSVEARSSVMFRLPAPPGTRFSDSAWNVGEISPDGRYVAMLARDDATGSTEIWLHDINTMKATRVLDSLSSVSVFWAPDSSALAFFAGEGLRRISVGGVRSDSVTVATEPRGGTWGPDGTILFAPGPRGGLMRVSANGSGAKAAPVISPDRTRGELGYMWPQFLPDGHRFIYFVTSNDPTVRGIYIGSLDGKTRKRLVASDAAGVLVEGFLLFVRDGNLASQRFDAKTGSVEDTATTLINGVAVTFDYQSMVSGSNDGTLVYTAAVFTRLNWRSRAGGALGFVDAPAGRYRSPAISADGRYLGVQRYQDTMSEIPVFDLLRGGTATTISRGSSTVPTLAPEFEFPVWGPPPDDRLAYASSELGWEDIYVRGLGASQRPLLLLRSESDKMPTDWSQDGRFLLYQDLPSGGSYDVWALPMTGDHKPIPVANGPADEGEAKFSPDGTHVAYVSNASSRPEIWIRGFPDTREDRKVSVAGGVDPAWLSNSEVSFLDLSGQLMIVDVSHGGLGPPAPKPAFQTRVVTPGASRNNYAWTDGGRRLVVNEPLENVPSQPVVITNWMLRLPAR